MLQKIRDKAQGIFAWVILILICVPFALWGIQNYLDVGKETPVATVGDKEFFQRDVNRAYAQFSQQYAGRGIPEAVLKQQALKKLISDEVLLQYVQHQGLSVTDDTVRNYIKSLQYFQVDGKFNKKQYQALLAAQNLTSAEFTARIKNALIMGQFQQGIINSSFTTPYDIESFFKIQNQQRSVEYVTIAVPELKEKPSEQEIQSYYQNHLDQYKAPEQVAIEYIELSLDELAKQIQPTEAQLQAFYQEHKDLYTNPERRKISHILFKFSKDSEQDKAVLEKALKARRRLQTEDFASVAKELSEDKLTADKGGDLGLFNAGDLEENLEKAVVQLKEGEISEPVKSAFGYHILKVTELTPGRTKTFAEAKNEIIADFKKTEAENNFYELSEILTEVSYENPGNLTSAADAVGIAVKKTGLFARDQGAGISAEPAIVEAAFSEDVLKGNNSEPIELGADRLVVLRMLEHQPATSQPLEKVKQAVSDALLAEKAQQQAQEKARQIKKRLAEGETLTEIAADNALQVQTFTALTRNNTQQVPFPISQAIFKAAKPVGDKPTIDIIALPSGEPVVFNLSHVEPGKITEQDKQKLELAKSNIARALGQADFTALLKELESETDVSINKP